MPERGRLLDKLAREVARHEAEAIVHSVREARRLGDVPPVQALREVAAHAQMMRARLARALDGHEITSARTRATLATLRHIVVDRMLDPERSYRAALLDLQHGIDVVKLLRDIARTDPVFGVIRWCDDWLVVRKRLVATVEAQLEWFAYDADVMAPFDDE